MADVEALPTGTADTTPGTTTPAAPAADEQTTAPAAAAEGAQTEGATEETAATEGAGGKAPDDQGEALTGAPEAYVDFTMPEGVALDADAAGDLKALAKDMNLSQAGAQRLADLGASMAAKWTAGLEAQFQANVTAMVETARADPEIGGEKYDETRATANAARDVVGTPALAKLLADTGLENHPDVIRMFAKIAPLVSEDKHMPAGHVASPADSLARMYPTMAKAK